MTKILKNVKTSGWSFNPDDITYGTLVEMGYLTKEKEYFDVDMYAITWTVVGDIEFTDDYGDIWKQGDKIVWEN